jgi:hypothetical protein
MPHNAQPVSQVDMTASTPYAFCNMNWHPLFLVPRRIAADCFVSLV